MSNGQSAYLIYGSYIQANFGSTIDPTSLQAGEGFEIIGGSLNARDNIGDIDGDGRDDIVIGDPDAETYGVIYIILSNGFDHNVTSFSVSSLDSSSGIKIRDESAPTDWRSDFRKLGPIAGDGNGGLYLTMQNGATDANVLPNPGVRHLSASDLQNPPGDGWFNFEDYAPLVQTPVAHVGVLDLVNVGDLIGDGKDDIVVVGEFSTAPPLTDSAGAVLIDGAFFDGTSPKPIWDSAFFQMWGKSDSLNNGGYTQIGSASAADVDGDGKLDLIIGEDRGGVIQVGGNSIPLSNGVYVIFGSYLSTTSDSELDLWPINLDPSKFVHLKSNDADSTYSQTPWTVSGLEDIDGDGYDEVMMSAEGQTYLISGAEIVSASLGSGQIDVTVDYTY